MDAEPRHAPAVEGQPLPPASRFNAVERNGKGIAKKPAPRPCSACQAIFAPLKESPKKPSKFCSDKCRSHSWRESQRPDVRLDRVDRQIADLTARVRALEERGR